MNEFLTIVQYYQVCLLSITKYYHSIVKYDQGVLFRLTGSLATGNSPALLLNSPIGLSIFSNFFCNLPALLLNLPLGLSSAKSLPSKSPASSAPLSSSSASVVCDHPNRHQHRFVIANDISSHHHLDLFFRYAETGNNVYMYYFTQVSQILFILISHIIMTMTLFIMTMNLNISDLFSWN